MNRAECKSNLGGDPTIKKLRMVSDVIVGSVKGIVAGTTTLVLGGFLVNLVIDYKISRNKKLMKEGKK